MIEKPWQCFSLISQWRSHDFYIEDKDELIKVLMGLEKIQRGWNTVVKVNNVKFYKLLLLK
jgi:hypothetical protein